MSNAMDRHRHRPARLAARLSPVSVAALAATLLASGTASAQSTQSTAATRPAANATTLGGGPDLQGLWDFTMRVGDRTSPGFLALGPVERGWAGSITMYLTNTLAIRVLTVDADSVRMVLAQLQRERPQLVGGEPEVAERLVLAVHHRYQLGERAGVVRVGLDEGPVRLGVREGPAVVQQLCQRVDGPVLAREPCDHFAHRRPQVIIPTCARGKRHDERLMWLP